jgi:hypothetical protein
MEKQVLLNRLANRVAEDTTDPLDKLMFEYLNRVEAESARAAFQKVLDSAEGLAACTEVKRQTMVNWKSKSEFKTQKRAEEAARTLCVYSNLYSTDPPRPVETPPPGDAHQGHVSQVQSGQRPHRFSGDVDGGGAEFSQSVEDYRFGGQKESTFQFNRH